ncbi:MAG: hypothetical protein J0H01_25225 [Rhizobiales bacterium]|nr:hypothetical protein [Hyphomicrobiales bacterium]
MTGSVPQHAAPDPMGDWAEIRSTPESPAPAAAAPQPKPSRIGAPEPERKKLLTIGLAMILAALAGAMIYSVSLSGPPDPPAPPRLAAAPAQSPQAQPRVAPPVLRTAPTAAPGTTPAPARRPLAELRTGPGPQVDTRPDDPFPTGPAALGSGGPSLPGQWRPSATFEALPDCHEPVLLRELTWLAGMIPELLKAGEPTTGMERATANGDSRDGSRACRADLRTTDSLYQVSLSLKVVDGVIEVTFLSLRKYLRGQPGTVVQMRPPHVLSTTLAVARR